MKSRIKEVGVVAVTQCEQHGGRKALVHQAEFGIGCAGVEAFEWSRSYATHPLAIGLNREPHRSTARFSVADEMQRGTDASGRGATGSLKVADSQILAGASFGI